MLRGREFGTVVAVDSCAAVGHRSLWVCGRIRIRCCRGAPCVRGELSPVSPLSRRLTSAAVNMLFPAVSGSPSSDSLVWTCALCREENFRDARVRLRVGSCVLCTVLHVPPARIVSVMRRTPCLFAPVQVCGWCGEVPASPHSSQGPSPGARASAGASAGASGGASAGARVGVRAGSASGSAPSPRPDPHSGGSSSRGKGGADGVAAAAGLGALNASFCPPPPPPLSSPLLHPHAFVFKAALSFCTLPFISSPPSSTTTLPLPYRTTTLPQSPQPTPAQLRPFPTPTLRPAPSHCQHLGRQHHGHPISRRLLGIGFIRFRAHHHPFQVCPRSGTYPSTEEHRPPVRCACYSAVAPRHVSRLPLSATPCLNRLHAMHSWNRSASTWPGAC
jgi:hypothetical protein